MTVALSHIIIQAGNETLKRSNLPAILLRCTVVLLRLLRLTEACLAELRDNRNHEIQNPLFPVATTLEKCQFGGFCGFDGELPVPCGSATANSGFRILKFLLSTDLHPSVGSGGRTLLGMTSVSVSIGSMRGSDRWSVSCVTVHWTQHVVAT
jgi:hypothetical protein